MNLKKTTALTFFATLLKLLNAFFLMKLVSVSLGPQGLARLGQFINFVTLMTVIAGGGINQGITKYVSEYKDNPLKLAKILNSGAFILSVASLFSCIFCLFFSKQIALLIFEDASYAFIFIVFGFFQFLICGNVFLAATINGFSEIGRLTKVNILGLFLGVLLYTPLILLYNFQGALIGFILSQSIFIFFSLYQVLKIKGFNLSFLKPHPDKVSLKNLSKFSLMALTTAILSPLVQLAVRSHIVDELSWQEAGYWEGVTKISDAYLMIITTILSVYAIPVLSALKTRTLIFREIYKIIGTILPLAFAFAVIIYMCRDLIIFILFSNDFTHMKDLFLYQLIGDMIRVTAMIFAYYILAKGHIKSFMFVELFCSAAFLILTFYFVSLYGTIGAIMSFAINSCIFLVLVFAFFIQQVLKLPDEG